MAQGGVSDHVLLAYIKNSPAPFKLTAEHILYLRDLGISEELITAMINRDKELKENAVYTEPVPVQPAQTAPVPAAPESPAPDNASVVAAPPINQSAEVTGPPTTEVTYNYFYSSLAPYGTWIEVDNYGWCWRPTVAVVQTGWRPYSHGGRWIYSDSGWYWLSDYRWGWAPFHYGRWYRDPGYGWVWAPDLVWGPSWVTWRWSDSYCGWAPLPPGAYYETGVGLRYYSSSVSVGFSFGLSHSAYTFVPARRFCDPFPWRYAIAPTQVVNVFNNTTVVNNYVQENNTIINNGIDPSEASRLTRSEIKKVEVRSLANSNPAIRPERLTRDGAQLAVYRPPSVAGASPRSEWRKPTAANAITRTSAGQTRQTLAPQRGTQTPTLATGGSSPIRSAAIQERQSMTRTPIRGHATTSARQEVSRSPNSPERTAAVRQVAPSSLIRTPVTPQSRAAAPMISRTPGEQSAIRQAGSPTRQSAAPLYRTPQHPQRVPQSTFSDKRIESRSPNPSYSNPQPRTTQRRPLAVPSYPTARTPSSLAPQSPSRAASPAPAPSYAPRGEARKPSTIQVPSSLPPRSQPRGYSPSTLAPRTYSPAPARSYSPTVSPPRTYSPSPARSSSPSTPSRSFSPSPAPARPARTAPSISARPGGISSPSRGVEQRSAPTRISPQLAPSRPSR